MKCPGCESRIFGLDCEKCGRTLPSTCPDCQTFFTRVDRYCRQCGRDLLLVNYYNRVHLRFPLNVLSEAYEYPPDRTGLKLLKNTGPLRELTRLFIREISEPMLHGQLLGTAVRVTDRQFPRLRRIASVCERILNLQPVNIFVGQSPPKVAAITAFTYGTEESACIFLTSGLAETMTENELLFVIGHEMGHIKSRHVLYLTIAQMLAVGFSVFQGVTGQILSGLIGQVLSPWQRKAEITADRAGLVCCQNLATAIRAMVKVALGAPGLFAQVDLEEYLRQGEFLKKNFSWSNSSESHPYLIHRVNFLREFHRSSQYWQLLQSAYDPECPKVMCPACRRYEYLSDHEQPLAALRCTACRASLDIAGIYCPHCHGFETLGDPALTLASFRCPGCHKSYFQELSCRPAGQLESHYDVLGIHESATEEDIEHAYLRVVKPTLKTELERVGARLTPGDIRRRIKAHAAYQVLCQRRSREEYGRRLEILRELYACSERLGLELPPELLPRCEVCAMPLYGKICAQCGPVEKPEQGQAVPGSSEAAEGGSSPPPAAPG